MIVASIAWHLHHRKWCLRW